MLAFRIPEAERDALQRFAVEEHDGNMSAALRDILNWFFLAGKQGAESPLSPEEQRRLFLPPEDRSELDWWRQVFACRFLGDNLPAPGSPLYGMRLRLFEETVDGLKEYR